MFKTLKRFFQVSLFEIKNDAFGTLFLTNHKHAITLNDKTYEPWTIKHSAFFQTLERGKMQMTVRMKKHPDLLSVHLYGVPRSATSIKIFHYAPEEGENLLVFSGVLSSAKISGTEMRLSFMHELAAGNRENNVQTISVLCPHSLYSSECGVTATPDSYQVQAINDGGKRITLSSAPPVNDGYYSFGYAQAIGVRRGVISHTASDIVLISPIPGLAIGDTILVAAGCDKRISTCQSKFNNVDNFGGFKYIPHIDPVNDGGRIA